MVYHGRGHGAWLAAHRMRVGTASRESLGTGCARPCRKPDRYNRQIQALRPGRRSLGAITVPSVRSGPGLVPGEGRIPVGTSDTFRTESLCSVLGAGSSREGGQADRNSEPETRCASRGRSVHRRAGHGAAGRASSSSVRCFVSVGQVSPESLLAIRGDRLAATALCEGPPTDLRGTFRQCSGLGADGCSMLAIHIATPPRRRFENVSTRYPNYFYRMGPRWRDWSASVSRKRACLRKPQAGIQFPESGAGA